MVAKNLEFLLFFLIFQSCNCVVDPDAMVRYAQLISKMDPERLRAFYPGTLWCGPGNLTGSYDQLGMEVEPDKCCRTHDGCPDYIEPGETKHGLTNDGGIRRYSCECDDKLRECFRDVGNPMGDYLGREYFDYSGTQCFREDYPAIECTRRLRMSAFKQSNCVEYSYDTNGRKTYQWLDVKPYSDI